MRRYAPRRIGRLFAWAAIGLLATVVAAGGGGGAELERPAGEVVLTVSGAIARTNADGRAEFDRAMLEALGLSRLKTWTPWTEGEAEFTGVLARTLMEHVGARGTVVRARGLNDYEATIPLSDFDGYAVLLAMAIDGRRLRVRDKGPLWLVYPWSDHAELDDRPTRQKSVWQLLSLDVR